MSLTVTLNTATSGLIAAQTGIRTVSDNIANVNTPGYVRKTVDQEQLVVNGTGAGVKVSGVKRVTDQYLQLASLTAASDAGRWGVVSQYLDHTQSLFGDPSSDNFFFSRLDDVWSAFAAAADDPSSSLLRSQALFNTQDFLNEAGRINGQINELVRTLDSRISADIDRANDLLAQIDRLNSDVSRATVMGADASGSQNAQSQLIDELSTLMNINVAQKADGGVTIRSTEGVLLAGEGAGRLVFKTVTGGKSYIAAIPFNGNNQEVPIKVVGGELRGLMEVRDTELPALSAQLGEFVSRAVERINAAHNASAAIPPPTTMTGRNTGLDLPTAVTGFSGQATLAVVSPAGALQRRIDIDFTAGTMTVDGAPGPAFTPATFLAGLNAALGGSGSASFANGVLGLAATGGNGLAIQENSALKAGRGFSAFFGLNDMIRASGVSTFETGLAAGDAHGFTPGDQITFQVSYPDGKPIAQVAVAVPAGATMANLLTALNDNVAGLGLYGQFTLTPKGALTFAAASPLNASVAVIDDDTERGAGGPSMSQLFGLSEQARTTRAGQYFVDPALTANPNRLALGQLDLDPATSPPVLRAGDGRGALLLSTAGDTATDFLAVGSLGAVTMTVSRYAAEFGGSIGRQASAAESRFSSAEAVQAEAVSRRQSVEGVNLDEELVRLMTYQQAFTASARLIQAADDLFRILTDLI